MLPNYYQLFYSDLMKYQARKSFRQAGKIVGITKKLNPINESNNLEYEIYDLDKLLVYFPDFDTYPPLYMPRLIYKIVDDNNLKYIKATHILKALLINCFSYTSLLLLVFLFYERSFSNVIDFTPFIIVLVSVIGILTILYISAIKKTVEKRLNGS